ncbi:hypothetical protein B0H11DRAFT_2214770 [Mycena galericulata]|nr:hypothetical protein B0H11DRAFT_2214770 [Mycena galericulata]
MSYTLPSPPSFACAPEATTSALIELISALIRAITAFCIRDLSHVSVANSNRFALNEFNLGFAEVQVI